jgi:hypothetical protein
MMIDLPTHHWQRSQHSCSIAYPEPSIQKSSKVCFSQLCWSLSHCCDTISFDKMILAQKMGRMSQTAPGHLGHLSAASICQVGGFRTFRKRSGFETVQKENCDVRPFKPTSPNIKPAQFCSFFLYLHFCHTV